MARMKAFCAGHFRVLFCGALATAGILWSVLFALEPKGIEARVFFEKGERLFEDFRTVRTCAEWGFANDRQPLYDSCYPALGSLMAKPFPMDAGGLFTGVGMLLWLLSFCALTGRPSFRGGRNVSLQRGDWPVRVLLAVGCLLSSIMLHAFEWGNQILYAAAASTLFLAWHDAATRGRRWAAAVALSVAAVLKIVPGTLALLYLVRWREAGTDDARKAVACDAFVFVVAGIALFVVPFAWYDGWQGFCQWMSNAAGNAAHYVHKGAWGAVPVGRTVRVMLHVDVAQPWPGLWIERALSVTLGLFCLAGAAARVRCRLSGRADLLLLLVSAMLLIPGNMHVYTGLYLLPVLAWRLREGMDWLEAACWFALLCPLQIPLGVGCLNHPLANAVFLLLAARSLWNTANALWYTSRA